jgi:ABC-type hemin transport system substrate-binding protein
MREIHQARRSGPAARDRRKPASDALSVTVARIMGSRAVIDQSRARIEAAAAQLAARSAEIEVIAWIGAAGGDLPASGDEADAQDPALLRRAG